MSRKMRLPAALAVALGLLLAGPGLAHHKPGHGGGGDPGEDPPPGGDPPGMEEPVVAFRHLVGKGGSKSSQLRVADLNGTASSLIRDARNPTWAPLDLRLAFTSEAEAEGSGLYQLIFDPETYQAGTPQLLFGFPEARPSYPSWNPSPPGPIDEIAFDMDVDGLSGRQIFLYRPGEQPEQVTFDLFCGFNEKSWAPDGNRIAVEKFCVRDCSLEDPILSHDVVVLDVNTGEEVSLAVGTGNQWDPAVHGSCAGVGVISSLDWSNRPGSNLIAISGGGIWCFDTDNPGTPVLMWDPHEDFGKRTGSVRVAWTGSEDYLAVSVGWQGLFVVPLAIPVDALNACPVKSGPAIPLLVDGVSQNNYISELDWRRSVTLE